jgi:hypothetical protein
LRAAAGPCSTSLTPLPSGLGLPCGLHGFFVGVLVSLSPFLPFRLIPPSLFIYPPGSLYPYVPRFPSASTPACRTLSLSTKSLPFSYFSHSSFLPIFPTVQEQAQPSIILTELIHPYNNIYLYPPLLTNSLGYQASFFSLILPHRRPLPEQTPRRRHIPVCTQPPNIFAFVHNPTPSLAMQV